MTSYAGAFLETPSLNPDHSLLSRIQTIGRRIFYVIPTVATLPWGDRWIAHSDVMDEQIRSGGGFETGEQQFLLRFLKDGMTVLDIGAHHGFYTLLSARKVGGQGRVFAFEPSPRERKRLEANVRLNGYGTVTIEPIALGASNGSATLHICLGRETGCNSLRPPSIDDRTATLEVPISSLDEYIKEREIPAVDFVKLDVEGSEREVLLGASTLLRRVPRPVFLVELADVRSLPWGYKSNEVYDLLFNHQFRWFSVTAEGLLDPAKRKETFHENLIAVPDERLVSVTAMRKD